MDKPGLEKILLRLGNGRTVKLTPAEARELFDTLAASGTARVRPAHGDRTAALRLDRLLRGDLEIVARMTPDGRLRVRLAKSLRVRPTKRSSTSPGRAVRLPRRGAFDQTETSPSEAPAEDSQPSYDTLEDSGDFGDATGFGEEPQGRAGDDEPF